MPSALVRTTWPSPPTTSASFAAIGTGPGARAAGDRIIYFNAVDGTQAWNNNNLQGNGEAVELIGTDLLRRLPGRVRRRDGSAAAEPGQATDSGWASTRAHGVHTAAHGLPAGGRCSPGGVFDLAQGSNRLVAVGDFTSVGTTGNLHGLAIFA